MPTSEHTVRLRIITEDQTSGPTKRATSALDGLLKVAKQVGIALTARKIAQFALEITKLGAAALRQETALDSLAKAAGHSGGEIINAIQSASQFTIDSMTAMQVANRAMIMDVAETPAQFERLTTVAVALGRAMGVDAATSIDNFVTAAGRQSRLIADNLGLIVDIEGATKRYATSLGKTVEELTETEKRQAFLNEMLTQGELKLRDLGTGTVDVAGQMEQLTAAWKDAKTNLGKLIASVIESSGALEEAAGVVRELADSFESIPEDAPIIKAYKELRRTVMGTPWLRDLADAMNDTGGATRETGEAVVAYTPAWERLAPKVTILTGAMREINPEIDRYAGAIKESSEVARYAYTTHMPNLTEQLQAQGYKWGATSDEMLNYLDSLGETTDLGRDFQAGAIGIIEVLEEERRVLQETGMAFQDMAIQYTSYQQDLTDSATDFARDRAEIEADHIQKIAELRTQAQAQYKRIDEEGIRLELQTAQARLDTLLAKQAAFNNDTSALERAQTAETIHNLQLEIAEHTGVLQGAHNGYLAMKGKNVDDLLAEEDRHYNEALAKLEASQVEQEAAQRESLGRMVLQHFESWAEMNGVTGQLMLDMRMNIIKEYGLATDAAIADMARQEAKWRATMAIMKGDAASFFDYFTQQFNALPSEKVIRIRTELATPTTGEGRLGGEIRQSGGPVRGGYPYLVGERGPELFVPGSSGTIVNNTTTQSMMDNRTININSPRGLGFLTAQERAAARNRFARASGMGA